MSEQLAIIRKPGYGMRDLYQPGLFFDVYLSESSAALQVFSQPEANEVIQDHGVYDVKDLEGRACWVESDNGTIRYLRAAKMGAR